MHNTINLVYVDDSTIETIKFEKLIKNFKEITVMGVFSETEAALEFCSINKPDLALLDIVMPGNNGIWLAERLNEISIPFAFISSHSGYAYDAFKISALHYLPRPITATGIRELIDRFAIFTSKNEPDVPLDESLMPVINFPKRIYINTQKQILIFDLSDILYLEAEGSYTNFHLENGKVVISGKNLKHYSQQVLLNPDFIKIHRSYIINQTHLQSIDKKRLEMTFRFKNKAEIKVATFRRDEWNNKFL